MEFEGVYMDSKVYLNGEHIGGHLYGYTNFYVDLTSRMRIGEENEILVIADNSKTPNSRWYSGSGIYRPVNLWTGAGFGILPENVKITTLSVLPAVLRIDVEVKDEVEIAHEIYLDGKKVGEAFGAHAEVKIADAKLWNVEHPTLYMLRTVLKKGVTEDVVENRFGLRMLSWSAKAGFQVNGKTVKLRGGCVHHDHGILGAASYDKAEYRRIQKLKDFGFNAIRYSHNPAGKNFLDACDELGMYVLDESFDQWKTPQSTYDYALHFDAEWEEDIEALVAKDYNHPCVIMYCIGNEITDTGLPYGAAIAKQLSDKFRVLDDTRPTTIAINSMLSVLADMQVKQRAQEDGKIQAAKEGDAIAEKITGEKAVVSEDVNDLVALLPKIMAMTTPETTEALVGGCLNAVDIAGYNYGQNLYKGTHKLVSDRVILSSETFPQQMANNWKIVEENPFVIGDFIWTAWDYLGEAGVGLPVYGTNQAPFSKPYPCQTAACGSFDLIGNPESHAYYSAILWGKYEKPYIAVRPLDHSGETYTLGNWRFSDAIPCWNWSGYEGEKAEIEVYSIGNEIELWQDGISLGKKKLVDCRTEYSTTYEAGYLEVVSFDKNGTEIGRNFLRSAEEETILSVEPEEKMIKADGEDLAYVTINLTDIEGNLKMTMDKKITVSVEGAGTLLALGSANPITEDAYDAGTYTSWHGQVQAIIRATKQTGRIKVKAKADGLGTAEAEILVQ